MKSFTLHAIWVILFISIAMFRSCSWVSTYPLQTEYWTRCGYLISNLNLCSYNRILYWIIYIFPQMNFTSCNTFIVSTTMSYCYIKQQPWTYPSFFLLCHPQTVIKINTSMTLTVVILSTSNITIDLVQTFMIFKCRTCTIHMSWFFLSLISINLTCPLLLELSP